MADGRRDVYLPALSKEDLKNLAKQQQKAKRDEDAKTRQTRPQTIEATSSSSGLFSAPVKVSGRDEDGDKRKLLNILGPYETMSVAIMKGKTRDLMGVEQQPATPVPAKNTGGFFNNKHQGKQSAKSLQYNTQTVRKDQPSASSRSDHNKQPMTGSQSNSKEPVSNHKLSGHGDVKPRPVPTKQTATSGNPQSSSVQSDKPNRSDIKTSKGSSQKSSTSHKQPKLDSTNQNSRTDISEHSGKSEDRVSVLQSFTQELIGQSKTDSSQSGVSQLSPGRSESGDRTSKKPSSSQPVAVLQESKGENRNTLNGKMKNVPKLQITPEKNVEDLLKELTHVPQPLTGIQTPFKEVKNPFQDKFTDMVHKRDGPHNPRKVTAPVKVHKKATVVEEIQDKSDSDTDADSGDDGSDSGDEDDGGHNDDDDSGSSSDEENDKQEREKTPQDKVRSPSPQQIPATTASQNVRPVRAPPEKGERKMSESSSSSGSESSGTESDSESELSDTERHDSPDTTPSTTNKHYMEDTSSPLSGQRWNLGAFLPSKSGGSGPLSNDAKPLEAPASDKSDPDHFEEDIIVKRSADHVSDENPQSVDPDSVPKPMSADEFSPPAPNFDKQILSPIKSPQSVKSPSKRMSSSNVDKFVSDSVGTKSELSVVYNDSIKIGGRNKSTPISSPGRSKKRVLTPSLVHDDSTSSESDIDIDTIHSPIKPLPNSPRKTTMSNKTLKSSTVPSKSSSNSSKKKESKQEILIKAQKPVKLKNVDNMMYDKPSDCDSSSATKAMSNMQQDDSESIKNILNSFVGEKLLSPIPCECDPHTMPERTDNLNNSKSDITRRTSAKYLNGKVSVLVQIDMNLLNNFMVKDKNDPNLLHVKPEMAKMLKDNVLLDKRNHKASKVTSAKTIGTDILTKSHKVLESERSLSVSPNLNHSANISQTSATKLCVNSTQSAHTASSDISSSKPKVSQKGVVKSKCIEDVRELPGSKTTDMELSDSVSSDSSESDSEVDVESKSTHQHSTQHPTQHSTQHSLTQSVEVKKRKYHTHRVDDSKRRKTSSSKVLHDVTVPERSYPETNCNDNNTEPTNSNKKSTAKRERHNSSSSQHSTQSQQSGRSGHSRRSTPASHRSSSQKRARVGDATPDHVEGGGTAADTQHKSSTHTALSTHSNTQLKSEYSEPAVKLNGHLADRESESVHHDVRSGQPTAINIHRQDREDEERLLSGTEYQKKATSYKRKFDDMPTSRNSLEKYIVFLESVLYFLLSGVAKEKGHHIPEASTMFKDTHRLLSHHFHQFRLNVESDTADKSDIKFSVLCLRIQSLLLFKLYKLKKAENLKLKRILDDHHNKSMKPSSQQSKLPSAPSPHQTNWNRSTGTPSPMSPTPSPANSVGSVGSVGSDQTPSKLTNGTSGAGSGIAPPGSVLVPQRIHSITQKYFTTTNYLVQAHELWEQAANSLSSHVSHFFSQLDSEIGPLTFHSSLLHLVRYCRKGIAYLRTK